MKTINRYHCILIILMTAFIAFACDTDGEETMSWKPGTGLHIVGPDEVEVGDEVSYYVDGFTVKETYTWTLDGTPVTPTRNGEFVVLEFDAADDHVLTVSNGTYNGSLNISVVE